MIIKRITDLHHIDLIREKSVYLFEEDRIPATRDFAAAVVSQSPRVFALGAYDDDELIAFVIAFDPGDLYSHVMVTQTWADGYQRELIDDMHKVLVAWAVDRRKTSIRAQTMRAEVFVRRFGWNESQQKLVYLPLSAAVVQEALGV